MDGRVKWVSEMRWIPRGKKGELTSWLRILSIYAEEKREGWMGF